MAPNKKMLRAVLGLSCAGSLVGAGSQPKACEGSATCAAQEDFDSLSALQTAGSRGGHVAVHNATGKGRPARGTQPFLGGRNGEIGSHEEGAIIIDEDGVKNTYYLPGATVIDGTTVEFKPPYRFYLMKKPTTDYSKAENFYKPIFPGKTFTVDMMLKDVGCGCNVNFYLVDMPVADAGKDHDHYCDGQCFDGLGCCAEFDMNEGNNKVQQITNHACTHDYNGHPDWACHKWGEPEVKVNPWEFSTGGSHTIDGNKPFTFSQEFRMTGDQLQVITRITQGEAKVVKTMGPNAQLQAMLKTGSLENGMAFVTGYWTAPDMNWLDGDSCGGGAEHCSSSPAYISNWRITTNSENPAPIDGPSPAPAGGKHACCWYGNCAEDGNWCNGDQDKCTRNCNGEWRAM